MIRCIWLQFFLHSKVTNPASNPQLGGPGPCIYAPTVTGWLSYTPRHWVPFSSPSTFRRAAVEVLKPASIQEAYWIRGITPHYRPSHWGSEGGDCKGYHLLGCDVVQYNSSPMFRRNVLSQLFGLKNKTSKRAVRNYKIWLDGFALGWLTEWLIVQSVL
jgi:hypothetical protein